MCEIFNEIFLWNPLTASALQTCEIAAENACLNKDDGKTVKGKQVIGRQTILLQLRNKGAFL
jgi:hypothetical protein